MLEPAPRHKHARIFQRGDDRFIGIALLTLVGDDALALEPRRILSEEAVGIDSEGDGSRNAKLFNLGFVGCPNVVVVGTMTRSGVDETSADIIRYMIAFQERDLKVIAKFPLL
jgi:hypothetical protein